MGKIEDNLNVLKYMQLVKIIIKKNINPCNSSYIIIYIMLEILIFRRMNFVSK